MVKLTSLFFIIFVLFICFYHQTYKCISEYIIYDNDEYFKNYKNIENFTTLYNSSLKNNINILIVYSDLIIQNNTILFKTHTSFNGNDVRNITSLIDSTNNFFIEMNLDNNKLGSQCNF